MALPLYGLVDAARDPLIKRSHDQACLFGGKIEMPLDSHAPYIVRVVANEPLFQAWSAHGRGQSWGIWCRSEAPLSEVRRHLRKFLQARLPDGRVVLFRFYDPRVWRTYLPTCTPAELADWFNGID